MVCLLADRARGWTVGSNSATLDTRIGYMANQNPRAEEEGRESSSKSVTTTRLKSLGEVVVEHHDAPPPGPPDKQIHPRHPLPRVPERAIKPAEDVEDKTDSSE